MNLKKITAVLLSAATVLSVPMNVSAELSQWQLECPDYSEIKSQEIDMSYFDYAIEKLDEIAGNPDKYSDEDVLEYAEILIDEFTYMYTLNSVYYIEFNKDVTNDELNDKLSETDVYYVEMNGKIGDCVLKLYDAGFEDVLRDVYGYDMINAFTYIDSEEDFSEYDDENEQLQIEIDKIVKDGVSDDEFLRGKEQIKGGVLLSQENSATVMTGLGKHCLLFGKKYSVEERISLIDKVTKEDVNEMAKRILDRKNASLSIVSKYLPVGDLLAKFKA